MPRKPTPKRDMTTEEVIHSIFPKRVVDRVKRELEEPQKRAKKTPKKPAKSKR